MYNESEASAPEKIFGRAKFAFTMNISTNLGDSHIKRMGMLVGNFEKNP